MLIAISNYKFRNLLFVLSSQCCKGSELLRSYSILYKYSIIFVNSTFILKPLYRELLTQRFSNYLSRIGLPNPGDKEENYEK